MASEPPWRRGAMWAAVHVAIVLALVAGERWHRSAHDRPQPHVPVARRAETPVPQSVVTTPAAHVPFMEEAVVALCPPLTQARRYVPATSVLPSGSIVGSGEDVCYTENFQEGWRSVFVVATQPPTTIQCPEPSHPWRWRTRRLHVVRVDDALHVRCVLDSATGEGEGELLAQWTLALSDPSALQSTPAVDEPRSSLQARLTEPRSYCEIGIYDRAYAPRARVPRAVLDALGGDRALRHRPARDATGVLVATFWEDGERTCIDALDGSGGGYVPTATLTPSSDTQAIATPQQWVGRWTDGTDDIAIRRDPPPAGMTCTHGEPLHLLGCGVWHGFHGNDHLGQTDGWFCTGTPVVMTAEDDRPGCEVVLRWQDGALDVDDNEHCGGLNVRFHGRFRRARASDRPAVEECWAS